MLKTNSKQARAAIRAYILNYYTPDDAPTAPPTFDAAARDIYDTFRREYADIMPAGSTEAAVFAGWCSALPTVLDCKYYYNRSAVADVAAILDETPTEAARYTERAAEDHLTALIYKEIKNAIK